MVGGRIGDIKNNYVYLEPKKMQ